MKIDELIYHKNSASYFRPDLEVIPLNLFNEFLEANVCIPKGENRHDFADEWHQVLEGATFQSYNQSRDNFENDQWIGYPIRIKPSDPIYEYQYTTMSCGIRLFTEYMTDKEFQDSSLQYDYWVKLEETKRERK